MAPKAVSQAAADVDTEPESSAGFSEPSSEPEEELVSTGSDETQEDIEGTGRRSDFDSSDDERPGRNTVGEVPLEWYKDEDHIGYDLGGQKLIRQKRKDRLDALLARNDSSQDWRTIYDEYNDEEIVLSTDELKMLRRIQQGEFPHVEVDPYEPENDWFSRHPQPHPIKRAPTPKSSFTPSKWEEKKIVKLVRALRKGWLKPLSERQKAEQQEEEEELPYLMWQDDGMASDKNAVGLAYIPAPKPQLPGHEESYHPPAEYLPTEEERQAWELLDPEDRPPILPTSFPCLRAVPSYQPFINERFERCLDLYLCPRSRRRRPFVTDAESLVPQLPSPKDLRPFPTLLMIKYSGHVGAVCSIAADPTGQWLASGGQDGTLRVWEIRSGRLTATHQLSHPIRDTSDNANAKDRAVVCVSWCPDPALRLLSAAVGNRIVLLPSGTGHEEVEAAAAQSLSRISLEDDDTSPGDPSTSGQDTSGMCQWVRRKGQGDNKELGVGRVELVHAHAVTHVTWHARGDYFASVAPIGNTQAILVHQLSRTLTQNPFRKNKGRVVKVEFHPTKPFFFVATHNHVRVYNLTRQALAKKLTCGAGVVTSLAVHPSGDHVIVGTEDKRLAWFDMDLSTKPYRVLRYHAGALTGVAFHRTYPLFASASSDASTHVFHGMVYQDLMTNPLIVPVKVLRDFQQGGRQGAMDCKFHPTQPWIFVAGADGIVYLFGDQ